MSKDKELKIEMAEQEAIRFNYAFLELFIIKILKINGRFFISDESYISEMRSYISSKCKKISENEWEYTSVMYKRDPHLKKKFWELTEEEREKIKQVVVHKLTREEVSFDEDIIQQTLELFGVTITTEDLNGSFTNLGLKLGQGVTPEKRVELMKIHAQLD